MDIAAWLRELGLEAYEPAFRDNDVDIEVLKTLTAEDLKEIGVISVGHRKKLLQAIAALAQADDAATSLAPRPALATPRERRQLTVLFCDLVGSTELAVRLDPEDLGELMRVYQERVAAIVRRWDGHVAKYQGDGALAYFGWPRAHEDDAERAVRTGLELVEGVGRLSAGKDQRLAVRVGIATGPVVVGDFGGSDADKDAVIGETPNLAARLQTLAEPGTVAISPITRRLVGGLFELDDLGPQRLKGFAEPLAVWRVVGESKVEGRFEALRSKSMTPLVGREAELTLLLERWERAKTSEGQVVLLAGEPGIGKSRMIRSLRERLAGESLTPATHFCSAYHVNSALHPVIALLERAAGFAREDSAERKLAKLEALVRPYTEHLDSTVPLLAALLALPTAGRYPPLNLTREQQKQRTFEVLLEQLEGMCRQRPVLAVYEDVHWIDPSTLELLGLIVERAQRLPLLVLITFRPEFHVPWPGHAHITSLSLSRLIRGEAAAMVDRITGHRALPPEILGQIAEKTDGIPLFVEELTKAVLESGLLRDAGDRFELEGPLPPLAIPSTLQDSLMARLDRLAPVKELAQVGACIGREFPYELLAAVVSLQRSTLDDGLVRLVGAELVFQRGTPPEATYTFKHALVQDAAYASLLRSRRVDLHGRIAAALEGHFADLVERQPELLAHHLTEAGLADRAIDFWLKAGRNAIAKSANKEAIGHLGRALALLEALPPSSARSHRELDLQIALGGPLIATKGFAAPDVEAAYSRAEQLARRLGAKRHLATALRGLCYLHHVRARFRRTDEISAELVELVEHTDDLLLLADAHNARAFNLFHLGRHLLAREHLQKSVQTIERRGDPDHAFSLGVNVAIFGQAYTAHCEWHLGYADRALAAAQAGAKLADRLAHPFSMAVALDYAAMLHQFRREPHRLRQHAEAALAICTEHGFSYYRAWAAILLGWATAEEGEAEEGIRAVRNGIRDLNATGAELRLPYYLGILAELHCRTGRLEEASAVLAQAMAAAASNGECWNDANLRTLEGDLLLAAAPHETAEAAARFGRAIEVAEAQGARSLALRGTVRLARLEAEQGQRRQARDRLASAYGSFIEGFETPDLQEARNLLNTL